MKDYGFLGYVLGSPGLGKLPYTASNNSRNGQNHDGSHKDRSSGRRKLSNTVHLEAHSACSLASKPSHTKPQPRPP